jgi:hypothetical protein
LVFDTGGYYDIWSRLRDAPLAAGDPLEMT